MNALVGANLEYKIKAADVDEWGRFGSWFESFIDLASRLYSAYKLGHRYSNVLIGVPKSDYLALALSIGFSRSAFLKGSNFAEPVQPENVAVGDVIEIRSGWGRNEKTGDDRLPKCSVGRITKIEKQGALDWVLTFEFSSGMPSETLNFRQLSTAGNKDITDVPRLFKVPKGTPERPEHGKKSREINGTRLKTVRGLWEGWDYQICPTLVVFGPTGRVEDYKKPLMRDEDLHSNLEIEADTLFNVARLDQLSKDEKPHFVNAVEQVSNFPEPTKHTYSSLAHFPFACLDGNSAILLLSEEMALEKKCLIGLWEMAGQNLQTESVRTFGKVASEFTQIEDFASVIGWTPPAGVQIWGWK